MGTSFGGLSLFAGAAALVLVACSGKPFTSVVDDGGGLGDGGTVTGDGAAEDGNGTGDGAPGPDSGPAVPLPCGGSACGLGACCVTPGSNNKFTSNCAATCPPSGGKTPTTLKCLSNANCAGVCCIAKQSDSITASCVLDLGTCSRAGGQPLCEMGGATSQCSGAQPCSTGGDDNWQIPTSLGTCGGH
jgi:hypothetical protein